MIILKASVDFNSMIIPALFAGILSILLGVYFLKRPQESWNNKHRRFTNGGKPSEYYIIVERIKGIFAVIMGSLVVIFSFLLIINNFLPIFG